MNLIQSHFAIQYRMVSWEIDDKSKWPGKCFGCDAIFTKKIRPFVDFFTGFALEYCSFVCFWQHEEKMGRAQKRFPHLYLNGG